MIDTATTQLLAQIVARGVAAGRAVEIDRLGVFYPDPVRGLRFEPPLLPRVFIAYVTEDRHAAGRLYDDLESAGFSPWMDCRNLLPGQNWPRAIEGAIETSDFFLPCFSSNSVSKRGGFQVEIRYALDCARRLPLDETFVVPVRLDHCRVPRSIQRESQYVDLYPHWNDGMRRLVATMRREATRRAVLRAPEADAG